MGLSDAQLAEGPALASLFGVMEWDGMYDSVDDEIEDLMARVKGFKEEMDIPIVLGHLNQRQWAVFADRPLELHLDLDVSKRSIVRVHGETRATPRSADGTGGWTRRMGTYGIGFGLGRVSSSRPLSGDDHHSSSPGLNP